MADPILDGPDAVSAPQPVTIRAALPDRRVEVDLTAPAGVTTALIGPNGAGKTTLIDLVAGSLRPAGALVALGDADLTGVPAHRRRVSILGQQPLLFPHLSVLENVMFGPRAAGASRGDAAARARSELAAVGCAEFEARRPGQLSGGQAQRVALARALAIDPHVLLLDEPLSALDVAAAGRVRQVLAERLAGRTCLLVTHHPLDVWTLAQHVVVLQDGRVADRGSPDDVLARPATPFVAHLAGLSVLRGTASGPETLTLAEGTVVTGLPQEGWVGSGAGLATIPPEAVALYADPPQGSPRNRWPVTVSTVEPRGAVVRVVVELAAGDHLAVDVTAAASAALGLAPGVACTAVVKATQVALHAA